MAWDKDLPADDTELRLGPTGIRANWTAIESADTTLGQVGVNLAEQAGDLVLNATTYRLFSKNDGTNTELYGINSVGNVSQLTRGATTAAAAGSTFLPGGMRMQWGILNAITTSPSSTIIPSLTTLFNISFAVQGNTANTWAWEYDTAPNFRFIRNAGTSSTNIMWVVIGV